MKLILLVLVTILFQFSYEQPDDYYDLSTMTSEVEEQVEEAPYPYLADINWKNGQSCAGTLISPNYVLTAAHCVLKGSQSPAIVTFGKNDNWDSQSVPIKVFSKNMKTFKKGKIGESNIGSWMDRLIYHNYDIAVIKLSQSVNFSKVVKAAKLPSWADVDKDLRKQQGDCISWYVTPEGMLVQPLITRHRINRCFLDDGKTLCTNDIDWNIFRGVCRGIRGGPLVIDGKVHGVAMEFGHKCIWGEVKFTRVASFLVWITDNTDVVIGLHSNTFKDKKPK